MTRAPTSPPPARMLILGGSGRLGGLLRRAWGGEPGLVWQARRDGAIPGALLFDPLAEPARLAAAAEGAGVVLNLAGVTPGGAGRMQDNAALALAALETARAAGGPRVILVSSAAVYGAGAGPHAEDAPLAPVSDYGRAKAAMEAEAAEWRRSAGPGAPEVCILRIGNVAGADQLLGRAPPPGGHVLHRFPDGSGPRRSYAGPGSLARWLLALTRASALPPVLNLAAPGAVAMEALLAAAGLRWRWRPAPETAIPHVELDVTRLARLVPMGPEEARAEAMVAELRALGGLSG